MKRELDLAIGEGLFSNEPVAVEVEFTDHTATLFMTPLTQRAVAELEAGGVDFNDASAAMESSHKLFAKILHGWQGLMSNGVDIPYTDDNRDRLAEVPQLAQRLLEIATDLAVTKQEGEEKN